jgi:hypothetical protein
MNSCLVCGFKVSYQRKYCSKHNKTRLIFIRRIKRKGFFEPRMEHWSYKALREYSEKSSSQGRTSLYHLKSALRNLNDLEIDEDGD